MDRETIDHYNLNAERLAARYESADMSHFQHLLYRHLPERGRVLEIGCGSGRDAMALVDRGYQVTAVDGSPEMIKQARRAHPTLDLSQRAFPLPEGDPLRKQRFDAIISIAVFMHIPDEELFETAYQIRGMLASGGVLFISVSNGREGLESGRDANRRLFAERSPEELRLLFERVGLRFVLAHTTPDSLDRQIVWTSLVFTADDLIGARSVDQIETIISRDPKNTTYKLALLRALCDIAQTDQFSASWHGDGRVGVPLGMIAEKWLLYYWPIIEADVGNDHVVIPQQRGGERSRQLEFRPEVRALIESIGAGGLSEFIKTYSDHALHGPLRQLTSSAISAIAGTIVKGPVHFTGRALDGDERFFESIGPQTAREKCVSPTSTGAALGEILVSGRVWREMVLIGYWVSESIVLRWAELTEEISEGRVSRSDVVGRLLTLPTADRDVGLARKIYESFPDLRCVWTRGPLRAFDVDHVIPFSLWRNNDLWNLMPAKKTVNSNKSAKLVSKSTILGSKDLIVHYWEGLRDVASVRFDNEITRSLVRGGTFRKPDWQNAAFSGLVENVEMIAIRRGVERWSPTSR